MILAWPGPQSAETARVEAFSDAVFAIAITLLVLEIRVPQPDLTGHGSTLLPALLGLWPSYLGYLLSCVTIGVMWVNHHSMFVLIRRTDRYFQLISVFSRFCRFRPGISFGLAFINPWASLAVHGFLIAFFLLPVRKPTSRRPAM
jgi:hypothetical protein